MRILHVEDYIVPDLGYQTVNLAKQHALMGHEVHILACDQPGPFGVYDWVPRRLSHTRWCGIEIHRLPVKRVVAGRPALGGLHAYIDRVHPDVVVAHGLLTITTLSIVWHHRWRKAYRLLVDDHMTFRASSRRGRSLLYGAIRHGMMRWYLQHVDKLIAVSEETRRFMVEKYGLPAAAIDIVPLGVDDELFHFDESDRQCIRARLGVGEEDIVIVYAGKINAEKDPSVLAEAFLRLERHRERVRVLIIGSGDPKYVDRLRAFAKQSARMILLSGVPNVELPKYYSAADIGCWPRASSLTALEAMACRLPVVVSDQPAAAERVRFGGGTTYPEGNVQALAHTLARLVSEDAVREAMGRRAEAVVKERFSWRVLAKKFLQIA